MINIERSEKEKIDLFHFLMDGMSKFSEKNCQNQQQKHSAKSLMEDDQEKQETPSLKFEHDSSSSKNLFLSKLLPVLVFCVNALAR